jgi:predicted LPLAT superfamily acyltransferase
MMKAFLRKTIIRGTLFLGYWPIRFFAWWIVTGYFLFLPSRRRASVQLYQVIFPGRRRWFYLYCTWRQFHSFATTYADRIEIGRGKGVTTTTQGREGIVEAAGKGSGGIILMSHLGSYEVAARGFQGLGLRLLIIMGEKEAKQLARDQREALNARGIHIQVATAKEDFTLGGLEAIKFIKEGGFVSVAGDIVWTDQRSLLSVKLFDHEVGLPSGPYLLALVSGAPLFTMFTIRVKRGRHQVIMSSPREVKAPSRSERNAVLQASAQAYASALEEMVRQHPFQWYIFEAFFQSTQAGGREPRIGLSVSDHREERE